MDTAEVSVKLAEGRLKRATADVATATEALGTARENRTELEASFAAGRACVQQLRQALADCDVAMDGALTAEDATQPANTGAVEAELAQLRASVAAARQQQTSAEQRLEELRSLGVPVATPRELSQEHQSALADGNWQAAAELGETFCRLTAALRDAHAAQAGG